jgi:hypothetical protein
MGEVQMDGGIREGLGWGMGREERQTKMRRLGGGWLLRGWRQMEDEGKERQSETTEEASVLKAK